MSTSKQIIIGLALSLVFGSCTSKSFETREQLMTHVTNPENGFVHQKSINGVNYELTYRPTDMLVQQEITNDASEKEIDSLRSKYNKYLYFNLSLSKNNQEVLNSLVKNQTDFGTMVNQLAFDMADKVHLISDTRDTIQLADYVYPRLYGMSGSTSLLFVYPRDKKLLENEIFHFTVEDFGLATGEVGFKMSTKQIESEPKLQL